jgi:hypothetical protein
LATTYCPSDGETTAIISQSSQLLSFSWYMEHTPSKYFCVTMGRAKIGVCAGSESLFHARCCEKVEIEIDSVAEKTERKNCTVGTGCLDILFIDKAAQRSYLSSLETR